MKCTKLLVIVFLLGCANQNKKSRFQQIDSIQIIQGQSTKQIAYNDIDSFKLFCNTIPNVILPINTNCTDNVIHVDNPKMGSRIANPDYIGDGAAIGKMVKDAYILIIYALDTSCTSLYLKTLNKKGEKIDEINFYRTDCCPIIDDSFDIGYISFNKDMTIVQIDSTLSYKKDSNGNQIPGLRPVGVEHDKLVYQLSDFGKFNKIK